jgi:hypothetical protein
MRPNKYISIGVMRRFWARDGDRNEGSKKHEADIHLCRLVRFDIEIDIVLRISFRMMKSIGEVAW